MGTSNEEPMAKRVNDETWMKQILDEEEVGHLGLVDGDQPYVIPINYAYIDGIIVLHCAIKGRKLDLIRRNPRCCFVVDRHPDRVRYHAEKRCHYRYHSVIVNGTARYVETEVERFDWILRYQDHHERRLSWTMGPKPEIMTAERCGIILIEVDSMTGRKAEGDDSKAHLAQDK
jgi:hypothetical protein